MKKIVFFGWILLAVSLFLYSFTQVDLSLTLSRASIFQSIEKSFQYLGWFNRSLSTYLYLAIILSGFALYGFTLNLVKERRIEQTTIWKIIVIVSVILFLSYNAFSYDLFNYIFDAKIITHYFQNPYFHKALDYPGDTMLSFMRWTHRTYPYAPFWLVITVPVSFIGLGYFLLTFYLFKLIMVFSFIGSCFLILKIAKKLDFNPAFSLVAFALNPLVLIESLVSAHNDIVMMFFALLFLLLFIEKKYTKSGLVLFASIAIKFATIFMIPAIIAKLKLKINYEKFFYILIVSMIVAVFLAAFRTTYEPWYLLFVFPFAAFVQNKYFINIPVFIMSLASLLVYVPYLYLGNWDPPIPNLLNSMMWGFIFLSLLLILGYRFIKPKKVE